VVEVAEAEGAKYVGSVILLVTLTPFGVIIIMDAWKFVMLMQQHNKLHKPGRNRLM